MKRKDGTSDSSSGSGKGKGKKPKSDSNSTVSVTVHSPDVITQMMDIAQPLTTLKKMLAQRLQCSLDSHEIYLQNTATLIEDKSLLEQGISAEGVVQFSVQVISNQGLKPRLNIVDIVKPIIETLEVPMMSEEVGSLQETEVSVEQDKLDGQDQVTRWIVCNNYRDEQDRLGIPYDPELWTSEQTSHWLVWAAHEFATDAIQDVGSIRLTGAELCSLTKDEFISKLPKDTGELFWTHLELLRRTVPGSGVSTIAVGAEESVTISENGVVSCFGKVSASKRPRTMSRTGSLDDKYTPGNRTGNNGQIQLWQFLLELLTDKDAMNLISWVGTDGEFKLLEPEIVAQKWGERKNKPSMNYEKLSRALRYYYDGDMIAKVHGQRFVYKFICDLKSLMGYSAVELNRLVTECRYKRKISHEEVVTSDVTISTIHVP